MFRRYFEIWFVLSACMAYEYLALNYSPGISILHFLKSAGALSTKANISTLPGRPISYLLGWVGFGLILITNFYIMRKRFSFMNKWGRLSNWLYFHIFCGLFGPTCIIFHSDLKVRGLVAISFWSMMIVAVSGVVGRYFFVQAGKHAARKKGEEEKWSDRFDKVVEKSPRNLSTDEIFEIKKRAIVFAGASTKDRVSPLSAFGLSIVGDLRMLFLMPETAHGLPPISRTILFNYGLSVRQKQFAGQFKKLLSYWHSFHLPFAFVMYITAIIHIVSASLFRV